MNQQFNTIAPKLQPRILVGSNAIRGVVEAIALSLSGYDVTLVSTAYFSSIDWIPNLPGLTALKRRLQSRVYRDLEQIELHPQIHLEVALYLARSFKIGEKIWQDALFLKVFDKELKRRVDQCDILHFVNGVGMKSAEYARALNKMTILGPRSVHIDHYTTIMNEEYSRYGLEPPPFEKHLAERFRTEYELADHLIVQSNYSKKTFIEHGIPARKIRVVTHFFNSDRFMDNQPMVQDTFRVLFVGQITPAKGIRYLVEGFLRANLPISELWLIGNITPKMRPFLSLDDKRIRHVAHMPQHELINIYAKASVLVLPTLSDSWSLVGMEAMGMGVPVIVTNHTGMSDVVRENVDGYVIPIRSSKAITERLAYLYENPDKCIEMAQTAHDRARTYSLESYYYRLGQTYKDIIAQSS